MNDGEERTARIPRAEAAQVQQSGSAFLSMHGYNEPYAEVPALRRRGASVSVTRLHRETDSEEDTGPPVSMPGLQGPVLSLFTRRAYQTPADAGARKRFQT